MGVSALLGFPPMVPRIPEIDTINAIVLIIFVAAIYEK